MSLIVKRLKLEPGRKHYLLYIGEIKSYGLAIYMAKTLEKFKKVPHDVIFIVPDVVAKYPPEVENVVVINPYVYDVFLRNLDIGICKKISARIPLDEFYKAVSRDRFITELLITLLKYQDELFVYTFESKPTLELPPLRGLEFLGADPVISDRWNDKFFQYEKLNKVVPVPEFIMTNKVNDKLLNVLFSEWGTVFATCRYSAAGSNSAILDNPELFYRCFENMNDVFMFARYIKHMCDPTVLGIVANEKEVFIAGVADQMIEKGNRFVGSVYPSALPPSIVRKLRDYTVKVGRVLAVDGYRGFFGCDYIVDEKENIYFVEVNARKQGTTMEFCCTFDVELEKNGNKVTLTDMEYSSIVYDAFPIGSDELYKVNPLNREVINWGTYNYKTDVNITLKGEPETNTMSEVELFKRRHGYIITDYIGDGFTVRRGTFVGRVIAVGENRAEVMDELEKGKNEIESCVIKYRGGVKDVRGV